MQIARYKEYILYYIFIGGIIRRSLISIVTRVVVSGGTVAGTI